MVVGLSPAASYQLFKYGGPETGPPKEQAGQSQFSIRGLFSGHEAKVQVMDYSSPNVRSNKKKSEVVDSEKILPHCPIVRS